VPILNRLEAGAGDRSGAFERLVQALLDEAFQLHAGLLLILENGRKSGQLAA
jgi:hypothetical protein